MHLTASCSGACRLFAAADAWGHWNQTSWVRTSRRHGWPEGLRPYSMRHSIGIAMSEQGLALADVGAALGRVNPVMTRSHALRAAAQPADAGCGRGSRECAADPGAPVGGGRAVAPLDDRAAAKTNPKKACSRLHALLPVMVAAHGRSLFAAQAARSIQAAWRGTVERTIPGGVPMAAQTRVRRRQRSFRDPISPNIAGKARPGRLRGVPTRRGGRRNGGRSRKARPGRLRGEAGLRGRPGRAAGRAIRGSGRARRSRTTLLGFWTRCQIVRPAGRSRGLHEPDPTMRRRANSAAA